MDREALKRSELVLGRPVIDRLAATRVILFGVGGVGGWAAEALVRTGLGSLDLVDCDLVSVSNLNRHVQATRSTIGRNKAEALADRLRDIRPEAEIRAHTESYGLATLNAFDLRRFDYVLDAIDSLSPKLGLILQVTSLGLPLFSAMGAASRTDPTKVRTGSIWQTARCPLARRIRKRLRHHDFTGDFQVVYSEEDPVGSHAGPEDEPLQGGCSRKAVTNGSLVTVTATFGMCLASLVLRDVARRTGG